MSRSLSYSLPCARRFAPAPRKSESYALTSSRLLGLDHRGTFTTSAIPLNRENAMRVPTLSVVRELDFIESLKSEGMNHQCRVKSVNAIVTRGRHRVCAQPLFQRMDPSGGHFRGYHVPGGPFIGHGLIRHSDTRHGLAFF